MKRLTSLPAIWIHYPDFLLDVIPNFQDPTVGIVQTRWEHLNKGFSLLTQLQAFGLDAYFTIEQSGRYVGNYFANFNGTGGVWRKAAIIVAGGWQSSTLTEDLDLSYRAQLLGWKFSYREDICAPAELPAEMAALKLQQYRWLKGSAECARKLAVQVIRQHGLPVSVKTHARMMGLSLHNTIAIIEGYFNRKTPFVRTPKFNVNKTGDRW